MKVALLTDQSISSKDTFVIGGWIQSLILLLQQSEIIELAVIGPTQDHSSIEKQGNTVYYKLNHKISPNFLKRIYQKFRCKIQDDNLIVDYVSAIHDFNPDIVQIFGVENFLCNVVPFINCKVVVHLQGLANPYLNAWFPPGISACSFYYYSFNFIDFLRGIGQKQQYNTFKAIAKREQEYFRIIRFFMGRTGWDNTITRFLAKEAQYFHVEEVLRPDFHTDIQWQLKSKKEIIFISVLSPATYKGFDLILKTAYLLKSKNIEFKWMICGSSEKDNVVKTIEKIVKKKYSQNNIFFLGKKTVKELIPLLLDADLFIHPSYIDNSPNSICEAQIIGMPVIAANVGGVSSLIENNKTGILIPANDPYCFCEEIISLLSEPERMEYLGANARDTAKKRHDRDAILKSIESVYQEIQREA